MNTLTKPIRHDTIIQLVSLKPPQAEFREVNGRRNPTGNFALVGVMQNGQAREFPCSAQIFARVQGKGSSSRGGGRTPTNRAKSHFFVHVDQSGRATSLDEVPMFIQEWSGTFLRPEDADRKKDIVLRVLDTGELVLEQRPYDFTDDQLVALIGHIDRLDEIVPGVVWEELGLRVEAVTGNRVTLVVEGQMRDSVEDPYEAQQRALKSKLQPA